MREPPDKVAAAPLATLAWLTEQARVVRTEVEQLRLELSGVTRDADHERSELLLAVNQQLMLAALRAESVAEIALNDLAELTARQPLAVVGAYPQQADVRLLAIVAHELRAPLAPIRAAASLLTRAHADVELLARLRVMIESGVAHMSGLVDDLLDVARASTGKFRLECSEVDLTAILKLAAENCRLAMDARQQHFDAALAPGPLVVFGDAHRLLQIVSNLLDNASKFTRPQGHISLSMAMHDGSVTIAVRDDGDGLTEAQLPHVFDLFRQGDRPDTVDNRGLGIGLSVVRELAEAHGGSVVAGSRGPNLGSEFVVSLPLPALEEGADGGNRQDDLLA